MALPGLLSGLEEVPPKRLLRRKLRRMQGSRRRQDGRPAGTAPATVTGDNASTALASHRETGKALAKDEPEVRTPRRRGSRGVIWLPAARSSRARSRARS